MYPRKCTFMQRGCPRVAPMRILPRGSAVAGCTIDFIGQNEEVTSKHQGHKGINFTNKSWDCSTNIADLTCYVRGPWLIYVLYIKKYAFTVKYICMDGWMDGCMYVWMYVLYCIVLCCIVLYRIVSCCIVVYGIVSQCIVMSVCMSVCMHACMYMYMYCMCICICTCTCRCICICM